MSLANRSYGSLTVFPVAFGAGHIGDPDADDAAMGRLLNQAVDAGINLFDTALSYGCSEDRLRRHLGARRQQIILSTKVGYGVPGHADWTPGCIAAGVDQALAHLGTDYIDIVHLHSCPKEVLMHGGVIEPLRAAVEAGKVRVAASRGANDALAWAVDAGVFGGVQASVNLVDRANEPALARGHAAGLGTLVKRSLVNAVWRFESRPQQPDHMTYWDRWQALALPDLGEPPQTLALRFALHRPGVSACLVGTSRWSNLQAAIDTAGRGPLPPDVQAQIESRYAAVGQQWPAMI